MIHRFGILSMTALSSVLLSTTPYTNLSGCNERVGPSGGQIAAGIGVGAAIAVGTVVLIEVPKHHHTIKGCVFAGPNGIEVHSDYDNKTYLLTGVPANVKVGDMVRVHGTKEKQPKGSKSDSDFVVENMTRDFGPCKAPVTPSTTVAAK